jgi:predicted MFS family arabinose efflux permease
MAAGHKRRGGDAGQRFGGLTTSGTHRVPVLVLAVLLSLGAAVSLGISRFAYGLLLPPMRADLGWSYVLAGALNTANAAGYLAGALMTPALLRRWPAHQVLMAGAIGATLLMFACGLLRSDAAWLAQRAAAGVASAALFIAGGLLAARLGAMQPARGGLLIGLYYGGTGIGIVASALLTPVAEAAASAAGGGPGWAWAWWALAIACVASTAGLAVPASALRAPPPSSAASVDASVPVWRVLRFALAGYAMFGVGYIGYMTFVVALLRDGGVPRARITVFYALLGAAVIASPRLWAGLLDRHHNGRPLALLNGLLGVATLMPAVSTAWPLVMASGLMFGGVFLSVVASTTALVRHSLPASQWAAGIAAFTVVFAAGQIVGPTIVGWIADGPGGLAAGLVMSAMALWLGAALALRQGVVEPG